MLTTAKTVGKGTVGAGDDILVATVKHNSKRTANVIKKSLKKTVGKTVKVVKKTANKAAKAASKNAGKLIAAGLVVGGGLYLENKFKEADEDIKNCMKVCLPENWDDYEYGDLDKSELKYRVLEGEDANPDQPLCTAAKDDCGAYCSDKCEDLHEYNIPGSNTAAGLGAGLGKGLEGLFGGLGSLFGKLFDPSGMVSKFSLIMIVLIIVMTAMRMIKK